jgi:hypothetical protein
VAKVSKSATLKDSGALAVFKLSIYNLLIASSLVASLLLISKFAKVSATGSLVE